MIALLVLSLAVSTQECTGETPLQWRGISVGGGFVSAAQIDKGYSPLVFTGVTSSLNASYSRVRGGKKRVWSFDYSSGSLQNFHGRNLESTSFSWLLQVLYKADELSSFSWGWSNSNHLNRRTIEDFLNYTGRTDYFTAFGPAAKYHSELRLGRHEFVFEMFGHLQMLGFHIPSGFVSSMPRGFGYEQDGFMASVLDSAFIFHPGSAINFGLRPGVQYRVGERSELGINYLFDYSSLSNIHLSRWSRGNLTVSLNMEI